MSGKDENVLVLSSNKDPNAYVVDVHSGCQLFLFKNNLSPAFGGLKLLPNSNTLAASQNQKLVLQLYHWSKDTPAFKCHLPERIGPIEPMHSGQFLVAGSNSGKVYIWDVSTGELLNVWTAHYKAVSCMCFTSDDSYLVTGGQDAVINVWSMADILDQSAFSTSTSSLNPTPVASFTDHVLPITSLHCGLGGINGRIFSSSLDRTCKIFSIPSAERLFSITCLSNVNICVADLMENYLYMGCGNGQIYTLDLSAAAASLTVNDATVLPTVQKQHNSRPWPVEPLHEIAFIGHEKAVTTLSVSNCGMYLVSGSDDGSVRVWDCRSKQSLRTIDLVKGPITSMQLIKRPDCLYHLDSASSKKRMITVAPLKKYIQTNQEL